MVRYIPFVVGPLQIPVLSLTPPLIMNTPSLS